MFKFFKSRRGLDSADAADPKIIKQFFEQKGWKLHPCYTFGSWFIAERYEPGNNYPRLAVRIDFPNSRGLHESLLCGHFSSLAAQENCVCVVLLATLPSRTVQDAAIDARVLLLTLVELDLLNEKLHEMERVSRRRYHSVKNALLVAADASDGMVIEPIKPVAGSAVQVIYRSKYTVCSFADRGGDVLLVCFGNMDDGVQASPSSVAAAQALELSIISVTTVYPNWYPKHDAAKWINAVNQVLENRFTRRLAFGVGQGGYGALKYSASLSCFRAVAISPVVSIDPWDFADSRYNRFFKDELHFDMKLTQADSCADIVLIYDSQDEHDGKHAHEILALKSATCASLPFAGAATSWILNDEHSLSRLLDACRNDEWTKIYKLCALARLKNADRPFTMAFSLAPRRPETACRIYEKYGAEDIIRWSSVCFRLAKAGKAGRVIADLEQGVARFPDNIDLSVCAALVALELGDRHKTARYIEMPLYRDPKNPTFQWIEESAQALADISEFGRDTA